MSVPIDRSAAVVLMGVAGSGKSTLGVLLAARLGMRFVDGDDLHPQKNRRKLAAGLPLDDADRAPWLDVIAQVLSERRVVVACSALRRRYRERLRAAAPQMRLVYLCGTREILAARLAQRTHEFMPAGLLDSQLATLEPPEAAEAALVLNVDRPLAELLDAAAAALRRTSR
ncbi:MAG: AAA family ATPase [Sinobacteraceae bacterium]|nr:AAA family ATPase [Nevskiaceae bacterium]